MSRACRTISAFRSTSRPCAWLSAATPTNKRGVSMSETSYEDFTKAFEAGKSVLVATTLIADLETPVSAFLKLTGGKQNEAGNVFLLESVEGGATRGRYSMIGMDPDIIWRAQGETCE